MKFSREFCAKELTKGCYEGVLWVNSRENFAVTMLLWYVERLFCYR